MEQEDNELLTLELIHRYVELLDKYFGSVSIHSYYGLNNKVIAERRDVTEEKVTLSVQRNSNTCLPFSHVWEKGKQVIWIDL